MFKDNTEVVLTRKEALRLHREMWTDMQKELGDSPTTADRLVFKREWLKKHGYTDVLHSCFLCEYVFNKNDKVSYCLLCPIDWSPLSANMSNYCTSPYRQSKSCHNDSIHGNAPISEILALQEKEDSKCTM